MSSFNLKILTPEREVFNGEAEKLVVRTTEGDVGIYAKHIDYVAALSIGKLMVFSNGNSRFAAIVDGFISVNRGNVTILTDFFEWEDEIDIKRAELAKQMAEKEISKNGISESEVRLMEFKLKKALNRISVAK